MAKDISTGHKALYWLCGLNGGLFVLFALLALAMPAPKMAAALPSTIIGWLHAPWTLATYMLVHDDFLHLLFNVLWLLWFGSILLSTQPWQRMVTLYIGGGLSGGIFYLLAGLATPPGILLGSSASVLAIMVSTAILMPDIRLHLFFIGDVKLKWIVVFMAALTLISGSGAEAGLGGFAAHAGGILFGIGYSLYIRSGRADRPREEKRKQPTAAGARRVASILEQNRLDKIRLDQLLDKIKVSGYESLSRSEKRELDEISKRISK